jgi:ribonuclease HI
VALPKITYGLDIWYTPPNKKPGQTKNSGSAAALRQLQKVQRITSLAIIGALRTTPTDFADSHAGLLPIELALSKATHRSAIRILTLPQTHPLHSIVQEIKERPPIKHASPLANLLCVFKLRETNIETITPEVQYNPATTTFTTNTTESRKKSIEFEKKDKADFKVYSDGSGLNEGLGAAAVLYAKNRFTPIRHLKVYLGTTKKHNTYEAEIIGAILALWLIFNCIETVGKIVSLYIDNQSVISAISKPKANPGQYLVHHARLLANRAACKLGIHWISSHSKVRGNEKVDELAKEAADGKSSARVSLPHILRDALPISASAAKQEHLSKLKTKWDKQWEDSDRSTRMGTIDDNFPFNSFRKRTYLLTRNQASLMIQLRCGHIPLNAYLFRIGKSESELCQACLEREEAPQARCRETIKHFIFECESFSQERDELVKAISMRHFNLHDIMNNTDYMRALASYINKTGRLKKKP